MFIQLSVLLSQNLLQLSTNLKSTECQTDPVKDDAFDWDLSDRADCETQTVPPTRANSTLGGGIIYSYIFPSNLIRRRSSILTTV